MKNQMKFCSLFAIILFAATVSAFAQDEATQVFKKGDRVKASPLALKEEKYWHECTVLKVIPNAYSVQCEPEYEGAEPKIWTVMTAWVKASDKQEQPETKDDTEIPKKTPKNQTTVKKTDQGPYDYLADREILDCDFKQPFAKNGSPPPPELLKKVIQCLYEKHSTRLDIAETVEINDFQIGKSRLWRIREDLGDAGTNTIVHPITVSWTWKQFAQTETLVYENKDVFNCFVDSFNKWQCALGQRIKDGPAKYVPRQ